MEVIHVCVQQFREMAVLLDRTLAKALQREV